MSLSAARAALAAALASTSVPRVYDVDPDSIEVPALVVANPDVEYDDTMHGTAVYRFPVALVVSRAADMSRAVQQIDSLIDSVVAAIDSEGEARVIRATNYDASSYVWGGVNYAGVTLDVEVLG